MLGVTPDAPMRQGHLYAEGGNDTPADDPRHQQVIEESNPINTEPPSNPSQLVDRHVQLARQMTEAGIAAFHKGNFDNACKAFSEALTLRKSALGEDAPKTASSHRALGCTLFLLGRYDQALSHLKSAETVTPNAIDVLLYLGYTHYRLKQYPQAITHLKKALDFYATAQTPLDPATQINAQFRLGRAYHKDRNAQETVDAMNEVLRLISNTNSTAFKQMERVAHLMLIRYGEQVYEERCKRSAELASAVADSLKTLRSFDW